MMYFRIGEEILRKRGAALTRCCVLWIGCGAAVCGAQSAAAGASVRPPVQSGAQPEAHSPRVHKRRFTARHRNQPAAPPVASDGPAQPATVRLENRELTIKANNSDLNLILQDVAKASGMVIQGLNKSARIFGVYGPGNPREVLTHLLDGSGYNFVMVGVQSDGAPRELLLTAQNGATPAIQPASSNTASGTRSTRGAAAAETTPAAAAEDTQAEQDRENRMQQHLNRLEQMQEQSTPQ